MRVIYLHGFASSPASRKASFFAGKFQSIGAEFIAPALDEGDFRNLRVSKQLHLVGSLLAPTLPADGSISSRSDPAHDTVLIGSSLGGYLAALLAVRYPREIARLVLLAPAFNLHKRWTSEFGPERMAAWQSVGETSVYHYGYGLEAPIAYEFIRDAAQFEAFPSFQQHALLFHGIEDPVVPIEFSETFAESHPNARLIRLQSGHELTDVLNEVWIETEAFLRKPVVSA